MSRTRPLVIAAFVVALLAIPASAAAADAVGVSGVVTATDGSPAGGVAVSIQVEGTDILVPATTDDNGAFAVRVDAAIGDVLDIRATGPTVTAGPDASGCVHSSTPTGRARVTIEALPLDTVAVVLDTVLESTVCSATATPEPPDAAVTPPATDVAGGSPSTPWTPGLPALLALIACLNVATVVVSRRRSAHRRVRARHQARR